MFGPHRLGPDIGSESLAALIGLPGFDGVMTGVALIIVDDYRASWLMNRILSDRGRMVASYAALDLHFADPSRRGFTIGQLRHAAASHGFASPGRMTAWAASLRLLGLFAAGAPGRPQRLVPSAKFLAMFRARMAQLYRAIAVIHPPAGLPGAALEGDLFIADLVAGFTEPYHSGKRMLDAVPELMPLAEREAGVILLMSVMLKDTAGEVIAIADLAREFSISRAHVRSILQGAEGLGLVARSTGGGLYCSLPGLGEILSRFFAALFLAHIFALDRALARVGG